MVSSREELWQEWTGSRSERGQEEVGPLSLIWLTGRDKTLKEGLESKRFVFSVCLTPLTYWPCPSSWFLPWIHSPSSSAASDHPWQTWRLAGTENRPFLLLSFGGG